MLDGTVNLKVWWWLRLSLRDHREAHSPFKLIKNEYLPLKIRDDNFSPAHKQLAQVPDGSQTASSLCHKKIARLDPAAAGCALLQMQFIDG